MFNIKGYKKSGFTLAEVLITLSIVGVISVMTIPPLVSNYQKKVEAEQVKKAFTLMTSVCEQMLVDDNASSIKETELYMELSKSTKDNNKIKELINKYIKTLSVYDYFDTLKGVPVNLPDGNAYVIGVQNDKFDISFTVNGNTDNAYEFRLNDNCAHDDSATTAQATKFKNLINNNWKIN